MMMYYINSACHGVPVNLCKTAEVTSIVVREITVMKAHYNFTF